jgi:hypothetical protein
MFKHILIFLVLILITSCSNPLTLEQKFNHSAKFYKNRKATFAKATYNNLIKYKVNDLKGRSIVLYALFIKGLDFEKKITYHLLFSWATDTPKADAVKIIQPDKKNIIIFFDKDIKSYYYDKEKPFFVVFRNGFSHCSPDILWLPNPLSKGQLSLGSKIVLMHKGYEISNPKVIDIIETKGYLQKKCPTFATRDKLINSK